MRSRISIRGCVCPSKISVLCLLDGVAGRSVALLTSAQNDYVAGLLKNAAFFCIALVTSLVKYALNFFLQATERKKNLMECKCTG